MGWSAQDIEKLRKQNNGQKSTAGIGQSAAPKSTTAPARSSGSTGWSAEKIDALRTGSGTKPAAKSTDAWVNRSAGTSVRSTAQKAGTQSAGKSNQNPTSGSLSAQVLGQMTGTKSGKTYAERNNAMPMQSASGAMASAPNAESVKKQIKDADAKRVESWYARDAQQLKQETEELKATDKFSDFDRLNQWMDADPQHRQLVRLLRTGKGNKTYAERNNAMQPISVSGAMASAPTAETSTEKREYTDAELLAKGYSRKQIREARQYIADFDALPDWQRAARRISNTIGGIVDTVASAPLMAGETAVRSVQNAVETGKNWNELQESVKSDDRQWKLLCLMTGGKTQYAGRDNAMQLNSNGVMAAPAQSTGMAYTDEELKAKGYSQSEIDRMRARISGAKVSEGIDPEKSLGYQMYKRGQQLNEAAQAGMSPIARQLMGVTTSAAENLAVAGISPALVLPVLSAQGGAEAMGQSIDKGESAGKTLAGGLAKFGAGWAINSVGAADLARTMGSDYAKDTLAGKLADMVRSVADNGVLAQQYPTVANAISGGIDNAMQAFVETYADKAIDAALGDAQAAEEMFSRDTFLQALESGLSGGASGALGGAVGTQLGRMSAALETADGQTVQRNEPSQAAKGADSSPEGRAFETERQAAANDRQVGNAEQQTEDAAVLQKETAPAASEAVTEQQTVQSSNPAVRQLAEAMDSGTLTSRTIKLFTPNAANEANRAAFAEAYGMELPETAAQTRQVLRQMEAERSTAQSAQEEQQEPEAVKQEQTGELQGSGREIRDGVMTTWNPDGPVETQVLDPEMAARAQAEQPAQAAQKRTVENTGETVETPAVSHSLDSSLGEGAFAQQAEPAAMRETAGLEVRSEGAQKSSVQRELLRWKVSEGAAQTLSRNMPTGIADESRYAAAASSLYRLGQMEDVTTFDKAMELAKGMNGLAVNTDYVLAQPGGAAALKIAWLQGKGEAEAGTVQTGTPGGALSAKSVSGSGRVLYKGTMRTADEVATKLIELNARATDTDAVLKAVLEGDERVKAYVDTAAGQIFFADSAGDVFGTVLHEDWHWYNALDTEGAKAVQQHVMEYLAKSEGFENIDELIRNKLSDYAQQGLTYGEAAEELVADAWRGIFDSEESFKRWVEFQRGQAEKNAGRAGTIRKVMNAVKDLLSDIVSRAKEVLAKDPENRAALKAQRLAEAEKRALQDEYFAHAEKAMENLRAAKENAAALENKGAAKEKRMQIKEADEVAKLRTEQQQLTKQRSALKEERSAWLNSAEVQRIEAKKKALGVFSAEGKAYRDSAEYQDYLAKRKEYNSRLAALEERDSALTEQMKAANERLQQRKDAQAKDAQRAYDAKAKEYGGNAEYRRVLAKEQFGVTEEFRRAGYILPDGQMLDFAQNDRSRDTDHREILEVFGPAEVKNGTEALNEFLLDGNVRVMAEAPGVDISADTAPTAQQLEQIRKMVDELSGERGQFILDISTADGRVAASKAYSGRVDADKVVLEIRDYYRTGELAQESELAKFRYQIAEQASRDAKWNEQQQASRVIAEKAAALDTLSQFFGLTKGVNVSRSAVEELAGRWLDANGSKADRTKLTQETEVLVNYLKADGADMNKAQALAETLAGEIQDGATYRNTEQWDEYQDLHKLEYTVSRDGQAKAELVKRYGSWSEAVAEARRHGVTLRQADGVRDGNPAELYESLVNDRSAAGGALNGESALWKAAAEKAGVAGALSMESTEWLDVLMNLHDAIKPKTMSRFADDAEYEDAKVELAGRIIGDIMQLPQLNDAEAIFEGIQRNSLAMAKAAAGSDERAAEVEKGLKDVQKAQSREFGQRLAQNQRAAGRNAEVQQTQQLQKQLDKNLKRFGVDAANAGDLNEKLTVLRESYEREMKAESKRMKAELQQMRDEARLELRKLKSENAELARQAKGEQQRADKAEYSLMAQEDEVRERDLLNQQRAAEWYREQGERLATERQVMQQQRDEEIAIAKRVAEKRVQRARDGRKMDELKRSVRRNAAALNQMVLRPSPGKYVSQRLIVQAVEVAKIADLTVLNDRAVNQLTRLQNSIKASMGSKGSPTAMTTEWEQTGVPDLITELQNDLTAWKDAKLADLQAKLAEAEALPYSEKALALQERLRKRIRETESRTYLPMTVDQMRMLRDITGAALTVIRNENKTVSLEKAEEVSRIAEEAAEEVKKSKGNHPGGALDGVQNLLTKYNLDMLGAERVLRMLGGYKNGGQMEKIGQMLNDGQYRQTKITIEGEKLFADVTGAEHAKEAQAFAGPGADLVDVGLRDTDHNAVPLTHAQLCSLYMHLQNKDSLEHLMRGGMVVPDAQLYSKGDVEQAYQKGQLVQLGMLSDGNGEAMADTILNTLEAAMTDYDRAWCADMKEFFGNYTTKLINETSLQLVGYKRATVQNYYPIEVHKADLATEIEGVKLDATIEGRGFLKNRVKSSQPILLEECSSVVQRSLRDTAAYAGLAAPIRDVQKILNAGVETRDGVKTLKNGVIKEQWGTKAVSYLDDLLTDLQTTQRHRSNSLSRMLSTLRGNYAGAVLTLNPGVAIAQAASLPTAAAVLGGDTMAAVVPFVKNLSPKQKAALEAEIAEHGDVLLQWRQRGTGKGELQSIGKRETLVQKGMDKVPGWLTGWINGMDEITVAALWEGSKAYVKNHAAEFEGAGETGSPAYWEAVNRTYQKVIEQTQPNYTVMQRAGIQRNPDEMVKTFTMFTTQRFQNAGILIDAVGDWKAQAARYKADASDANKAELQRATKQRDRAILSQAAQVAVFAMMKIGADFLLHRWDREQDENGDVTLKSMVDRFFSLSTESTMGNFLFGSELYSLIDNAIEGKDYDVISATNISAVNDMASDVVKFTAELKKDTSEMDEAELEKHHKKLMEKGMALIENGFEIVGVPYGNGRKMVDAVRGYWDDAQNVAQGGKFSFNSLPESATGQYDRLYNAYASGDADEAQAAVEKLVAMGKEGEIYKQLKTRLKKYDADTRAAAKAQMEGNEAERYRLETETIEALYDVLGIRKNVKEDAPKREAVIDCVTGAVNALETEMLKGDAGDMYADLSEAVDSRKAQDVQAEYDRLMKAGRTPSSVKSKLTELAKPEYLAGSDADKQQLADVLLALTDMDGNALYTEKTFAQWEKAAEKAAQAKPEEDPYALLR